MAAVDDSDYGSDVDELALGKVLSSCAKPGLNLAKAGKVPALEDDSDYGSDIDETVLAEDDSDYGSDIDSTIAERLLLNVTPVRRRAAQPKDMQSLSNCAEQAKSNLLSLAPELRNLIYEKLFEEFTAEWVRCKFYAPPSVLLACKQIYGEAITVFYGTATFRAKSFNILDKRIRRLRYCYRRLIRKLDIDTQEHFTKLGCWVYLSKEQGSIKRSEEYAENELTKVRDLCKTSSLKELDLRSLRASIKLPSGETLWSEEPTKALADYEEARRKTKKEPVPTRPTSETVTRVTLFDKDWADGVWSNSLQTFVLLIPDD
ncbi:hypothetical protein B0A55_06350 [Friedmanniomyces simplex]|uniref:Uncharacterized protein n=1 Tax=Friedmanniomyces simplex TaxID=329884 RepID=A0A4U0XFD9_9PEZI|nr:hypothetical protein B0A55_06350 [Friedmanniomyces simplex]